MIEVNKVVSALEYSNEYIRLEDRPAMTAQGAHNAGKKSSGSLSANFTALEREQRHLSSGASI